MSHAFLARSLTGSVVAATSVAATAAVSLPQIAVKPDEKLAAQLTPVLQAAVREHRIVGAVLVVAQDGKVRYSQAIGLADREAATPMRVQTMFRLASMTKPLVAVTALQLAEAGKLRMSDPVTRYLPDFRPRLADGSEPVITLQQLITHTSGLGYRFGESEAGAYARLGISDGLDDAGKLSLEENLRRLAKAPLYFAPGTAWRYSLGIDVLGAVIEKVTGQSLATAVGQAVTKPLRMAHTRFLAQRRDELAAAYADGKPQPQRMTRNMFVPLPEGIGSAVRFDPQRAYDAGAFASGGAGMVGNAGDYVRFLEAIRTGGAPLLKPESVALLAQEHVGAFAQTQGPGWGFGLMSAVLADPVLAQSPQGKGTMQWGGAYGHSWFIDPERKLSVVLLTNTAFEGMAGPLVGQVRDAIYSGLSEKR